MTDWSVREMPSHGTGRSTPVLYRGKEPIAAVQASNWKSATETAYWIARACNAAETRRASRSVDPTEGTKT